MSNCEGLQSILHSFPFPTFNTDRYTGYGLTLGMDGSPGWVRYITVQKSDTSKSSQPSQPSENSGPSETSGPKCEPFCENPLFDRC